jgi:hypothetical protein
MACTIMLDSEISACTEEHDIGIGLILRALGQRIYAVGGHQWLGGVMLLELGWPIVVFVFFNFGAMDMLAMVEGHEIGSVKRGKENERGFLW